MLRVDRVKTTMEPVQLAACFTEAKDQRALFITPGVVHLSGSSTAATKVPPRRRIKAVNDQGTRLGVLACEAVAPAVPFRLAPGVEAALEWLLLTMVAAMTAAAACVRAA